MNYPQAPKQYDRENEALFRSKVAQGDDATHKRGRDIEVGKGCRLIFVDTATGTRYAVTVASGALTLTSL